MSAVGQRHFDSEEEKEEAKREVWRKLVQSHRLGYMATLRNLRNMLKLGMDEETMQMVCNYISNPEAVRKSKQLPFRFLSAFLELTATKIKDVDSSIIYIHGDTISSLRKEACKVQKAVEKMRQGFFRKTVRVVKRFYAISDRSLFNMTDFAKELGIRPTMRHCSYRTKKWKYCEHPTEKDMEFLKSQENYLLSLRSALGKNEIVLNSLEAAVCHTAENIPGFDENTRVLLASDTSGSMLSPVSKNSSVMCYHIGLLLSMLMRHRCKNVVTGMFGTYWKAVDMSLENILQSTVDMISREGEVGYATNGYKVIEWLIKEHREMDKVMLFTDCQLWNSEFRFHDASLAEYWERYKREVAPHARLYIFDLAGYGQSPISMKRDDVFCIAGWSDKVFDILAAVERGKSAIDEIRRIGLRMDSQDGSRLSDSPFS